ncbi:MAG: PAS domain S-box protein [Rhodocyclaceae bacterium]
MISPALLERFTRWAVPALLCAGLGLSALVGWNIAADFGTPAGLRIFAVLGLVTVLMTALLFWALRLARREARRAETALAAAGESAERFRELLDLSSDWYWEQDAQLRFTGMSGGVVNKGGFRIDQTLGRTRWELPILDPDPDLWRRHREQIDRREPFHDLRYAIRVSDGSVRHYAVSGRPRFAADGAFLGYRGIGRDITTAVQAEADLRRSEARLLKAQSVAQTGSWELDIRNRRLSWSDETYRIFGLTPGSPVEYALFADCVHPEDRQAVHEAWQAAMTEGLYDIEHRILAGGAVRWVRERAEITFDDAGRPLMGIGTVQDVTERKEAELKLRLAASVFENSLEGVVITDAGRNIVSVNRAFTRITGYEAAEIVGKNPRLLSSGRQDESFYAAMWQAIEGEGFWSGEIWNRRKNGEVYPELLSISAVRDERGRPLHYIGIFTDISALKRAEEEIRAMNAGLERRVRERTAELEASNHELEAFSYSVSHDLRAPLRAIDGFAHILAEDYRERLDAAAHGHLQRIRGASQRLSQTIDDMIELGRIARLPLNRETVDLSAEARALAEELAGTRDPLPEVVIAPSLVARADPVLARIVLQNLLENALKFSSRTARPRVEFGAAPAEGGPEYCVRDNGVGFDPAYADKLFQPFQRLHGPDAFPGTGVGLASVRRIVERHGGRVRAESQPGQGATFYFTLP